VRNVLCIIILLAPLPCCARTITVAIDAPADFNNIQAAISDANDGDNVEIQPGTYTGPGNTDIDFLGKPITLRSTNPTDPETVAQTVIDCNNAARAFLFQAGEDANSILDGLTIINGYATGGTIPGHGGAIYCTQSGPVIENCTMTRNAASWGGAIRCGAGSSAVIRNCLFTHNSATVAGAIYCDDSSGTIAGCLFRSNYSTGGSTGAVKAEGDGNLTITDCTFQENSAWTFAGAINASREIQINIADSRFIANSALPGDNPDRSMGGAVAALARTTLTNCLFVGNSARRGGALLLAYSDVNVANCTFADNYAHQHNAIYFNDDYGGYPPLTPPTLRVENSIVWGGEDGMNTSEIYEILVAHTDIPGRWPGYANIDADPCFANPGYWDPNGTPEDANDDFFVPGDYHLKSQAGRWDAERQVWVRDNSTSPCIDAGDPNSPLGQEPFPNGGRINMGAYGATAQASKSYFGKPPCETIVAGDINGDCTVNSIDFSLMSAHWLGLYYRGYPAPAKWTYPPNGQEGVSIYADLGWLADCYPPYIRDPHGELDPTSSCAASHDVYFGTDYTALRDADRNSPQYKGNQPADQSLSNAYMLDQLDPNTPYYWRIDEIAANGTITTGSTWSFTTEAGGPR